MIDWYSVGFAALWILGLGLLMTGLSLANYLGSTQICKFRKALRMPVCRTLISLGLVIFCIGLAGSVSTVWEHLLWAAMALLFALQSWQTRKINNP
jgi:hypothetical protein